MKNRQEKRIGILTWHYYSNFGSRLQAYALQTTLRNIGYDPQIINYQNPQYSKTGFYQQLKNQMKYILNKSFLNTSSFNGKFDFCDLMFEREYLNQTHLITSKEHLSKIVEDFSTIVYGSDQIWAPNVFNDIYMGAGTDKRKISYAASIGLNRIPYNLVDKYNNLLRDFYKISVREETAQALLRDDCGIDSLVVLDPTLLVEVNHYADIEKRPREFSDNDFAFCYFLNANNNYTDVVYKTLKGKSLRVCGYSLDKKNYSWMTSMEGIGPREFIWLIDKAKLVFTDSYHGTIFSLLFHKNFYTFQRFSQDDPVNQNSRIFQLDKWFNIADRIVGYRNHEIPTKSYDYSAFEKSLSRKRAESLSYLKEALY